MMNPAVVEALTRLAAKHDGELHAKAVVDAARDVDSVLHRYFDWDDSRAAERFRLWQARDLIRVVVTYEPIGDGTLVPYRVFTSLTPNREDDSGYRVTAAVLADPDQRRQLLADARADMTRFAIKYRQLSELAAVFKAMETVKAGDAATSAVVSDTVTA